MHAISYILSEAIEGKHPISYILTEAIKGMHAISYIAAGDNDIAG